MFLYNKSKKTDWVVWTSELSPFGLKVILLCRYYGLLFRVLPAEGSRLEQLKYMMRRKLVTLRRLPLTWPEMTEDDEFPLVPFLFGSNGENLFDSTAIAAWFDRESAPTRRLLPDDPIAHYLAGLIDDFADELGLYYVHHNRWVLSARDNDASERLAREFGLVGPLKWPMVRWWTKRQTERLPYLFSIAPEGFRLTGAPVSPPSRDGFPPTHRLLESTFDRLIKVLDTLLSKRSFILGDRMTLADASLYGQLGMNLSDPSATGLIQSRTPRLHAWLERLHTGDQALMNTTGKFRINADLTPLLQEICHVFVPLMQQNKAAYEDCKSRGVTVFNERAFEQNLALYSGTLDGHPFRHCVKTFQSKVWRERVAEWHALPAASRRTLEELLPVDHGLGKLTAT